MGWVEAEKGTLWTHVDLSDVEDLAGADKAFAEIHLHRGPKDIIRLPNTR
jgi:hypothetical protein